MDEEHKNRLKLRDNLADLLGNLDPRMPRWMIDYARKGIHEQLEKVELKIMRFEHFTDGPSNASGLPHTRADKLRELRQFRDNYTQMMEFLTSLDDLVKDVETTYWATEVVAALRNTYAAEAQKKKRERK